MYPEMKPLDIHPDGAKFDDVESVKKMLSMLTKAREANRKKVLEIESQIMQDTEVDVYMLRLILKLAIEAGYTHIKDNWGPGAYDELTIDEAQSKFGKI